MGSIIAFIFILAISSIIKNLEKTNKVEKRELQGQPKKIIVEPKYIQSNKQDTVKSLDTKHETTSPNKYNGFLEKAQKQKRENLKSKTLKNFSAANKQKRNNFYLEDIFVSDQMLKAVILKEILDPPKAFSSEKISNINYFKYY